MAGRILIVEDDRQTSDTLRMYLEKEGFAGGVRCRRRDRTERALDGDFKLVILDLMLPRLSGSEVCRALRRSSHLPVIMLTARTTEDDRIQGLELGADDYVSKPFSPRELVVRVKAVLRRTDHPELGGRERLLFEGLTIDLASGRVETPDGTIVLTPAEFKVLTTLARSPGRVFVAILARHALGDDFRGLDRTVDAHVMNLRKKIEPDRAQPTFVETVFGQGYRFGGRKR